MVPLIQKSRRGEESGQAVVEYVLLLMMVLLFFAAVRGKLISSGLMAKLTSPLEPRFTNVYQYGHVLGDAKHPRKPNSNRHVRLFYVKNTN